MHCRSCTVHCPQAVRQCIAGVALPTAPRQWGNALRELHCPLPPGSEAVHCRSCTAYCPRAVKQCIAGVALPTAVDSAAWHVGCSGPMRPCVAAHRRRHGSVGQVRECTGPAMQQHTYTQRAHDTHSPARLPLPVGRHPGLLPFGNRALGKPHHATPHHTTSHHTTPHHSTSHHIT